MKKLILIGLCLILTGFQSVNAEESKYNSYLIRYELFKNHWNELWQKIQVVDISNLNHELIEEIFAFRKIVGDLGLETQRYNLDRAKLKGYHTQEFKNLYLLYKSCEAMGQMIILADDYLSMKNLLYYRAALRAKETWESFDAALIR